jgi:RNA polymerase sigma-70 factor (ECF subfamily)
VAIEDLSAAGDAALVIAVGRSDEAALAELYQRHGSAVLRLAERVLRVRELAEDVTQEVFVRLWNEPDRFDPERGSLRSFLLAQAHRRAVDVVRSETSRRRREERDGRGSVVDDGGFDRAVWDLTVAEHVKVALERLPEREREAIALAYFDGLTYREVATTLAQPEGTVKSRIRSGLRNLRASLVDAGVEP